MLSDAIHVMRERLSSQTFEEIDIHGLALQLRAYEIEARNMETRIEIMTGRPHVAFDGQLISAPAIEIGGQRHAL